ncbi:MAG: TonB-dependent receptor, partial [Bryobacteraceae bacterium]|nr:TonB-dependent receptor [Bryobacteraceae bacterium]
FAYGRRSWRTRGSVYRAYRAPTLNELYREFRAGNTVTQANAALEPEKVFGAEIGADYVGEKTRVGATLFRNDLEGIITNVTLRATPQLITRQRQNFGSALSRGLEIDARREWGRFRGEAAYLFVENRFAAGLRERVPQIPKHQGSMQLTWRGTRTMISAGLRSSGLQFEDDRNTQLLPGFATAQLMVRHEVGAHVSAMLAIENLLGREYLTGFTPAPQIGPPRLWRIGLRWEK